VFVRPNLRISSYLPRYYQYDCRAFLLFIQVANAFLMPLLYSIMHKASVQLSGDLPLWLLLLKLSIFRLSEPQRRVLQAYWIKSVSGINDLNSFIIFCSFDFLLPKYSNIANR
ncbi:hypothetical protein H312_00895, partial [Anncaliia algerae PRA339]